MNILALNKISRNLKMILELNKNQLGYALIKCKACAFNFVKHVPYQTFRKISAFNHKMRIEGKIYQYFRQILMTGLLLFLTHLSVFSQLTIKQLDKIYKNNQLAEFEQILFNLHNETITEWTSINNSDTLNKINDLFNTILPDRKENESKEYFILQASTPRIFINETKSMLTKTYVASTTKANLKPLKYNIDLIGVILDFIGSNPYDNSNVKEYLNDKGNLNKSKIKKAESLIADYKNKTKFIGQYLILPATWGKLDRSLVPYEVNIIVFNSDLTKAEITYDLTWRGATDIFKLIKGTWIKEKTVMEWVH